MNPQPFSPSHRICSKYFEEHSSPFRKCFKQVPHKKFMQMCLNEQPQTEQDICKIAAFYKHECNYAGVPIKMPQQCGKLEWSSCSLCSSLWSFIDRDINSVKLFTRCCLALIFIVADISESTATKLSICWWHFNWDINNNDQFYELWYHCFQ